MRAKANPAYETMPPLSELIARGQAGDEEALEQIIRDYQRRVAGIVISIVGNDDDWQDLCQQIFVKMVLSLPRLKQAEVFEPWLFKIARNSCFDYLRRRRSRWLFAPWERWHDSIAAEMPHRAESRSAALEAAIERLPSDQRELMTLMRSGHWSSRRLALMTGDSVAAIKSRIFRARRRLRQIMTESESKR
jgi:RNA polymerase sigma-70 factor, ECF subfamily